ncbi:hypothetical protein HYN48_04435 [Flavobacterium magnum]|uniref:Right handed beta helix domain-containing protein n=1 Tax=Flavobacterium magnum TaxID=2162713 RepID=A0A2S0RE52_9FLAO|nr:hypothetical protein [Flavobacterium magnum]AWA29391.1 hypothetical protein HYN48_04435 [Flavobacterium magnum]
MANTLRFLCCFFFLSQAYAQNIRYVTPTGSGTMDGSSWSNAGNDLQLMMDTLPSGGEVWVKAGNYVPTRNAETGAYLPGNRHDAFVLRNNVTLYGGFNGTETTLAERDPYNPANETVLDGDLDHDDTPFTNGFNVTGNAFHVVVAAGLTQAGMDGFTIARGYAISDGGISVSGYAIYGTNGGGLYARSSTVNLRNIRFTTNTCVVLGGAIYGITSTIDALNCTFDRNFADDIGFAAAIAIENYGSSVPGGAFTNCVFTRNSSNSYGTCRMQIPMPQCIKL